MATHASASVLTALDTDASSASRANNKLRHQERCSSDCDKLVVIMRQDRGCNSRCLGFQLCAEFAARISRTVDIYVQITRLVTGVLLV